MTTITLLPTTESRRAHDLIAIPSDQYDEFMYWKKTGKKLRYVKATPSEKRAIARARRNFAKGNYLTLEEVKHDLGLDS